MWGAIIGAVVALIGMIVSSSESNKQRDHNMSLAQFQNDANQKLIQQQNEYNSPENQMKRFQVAGLNKHLIYGQGSPGNQTQAAMFPDIKPANFQGVISDKINDLVPLANQTMLARSQVQAQNASTLQKHAATEVAKLQAAVLKKNPALDDEGFKAMIEGLKASAMLKAEQAGNMKIRNLVDDRKAGWEVAKVKNEVEVLEQRFKLGQMDEKQKAETLKSAEFRNAILEVQKKFMVDADITPQHFFQLIVLLLSKAI